MSPTVTNAPALAPVALKKIRLDRLTLSQFKGVRRFTLDAGGDLTLLGDNASGKTSCADAFAWLLFGKDSSGKADFEIKTLDSSGEPLHGVDHSVRAKLTVGGETLELEKIYREKWQKRRGQADREFTGHTTQHFLDSVPVKEKDYQAAIAEIADEAVFRLLTDPVHFPERLHWQARREILLEVCGDVPDAVVIASTDELADLPEILGARSIDDHRKVAQARKRKINEELQRVPVRIDEVSRGIPNQRVSDGSEAALERRLQELREERAVALRTQARISSGGEIAEKTKRLRELEGELLEEGNRARAASTARAGTLRKALRGAEGELDAAKREATRLLHEVEDADAEIVSLKAQMEELRARWREIDDGKFMPAAGAETCAACGQSLPAERVAAAREKGVAAFNAEKSSQLEGLDRAGKLLGARRDRLFAENGKRDQARKAAEARAEKLLPEMVSLQRQLEAEVEAAGTEALKPSERGLELEHQKHQLEAEIAALHESNAGALETAATGLQELGSRIAAIEAELSKVEQRRAAERRIDELRKEERWLAAEYEDIERQLYLLEEFTRRKVSMLTERINSRFELARFRLFETQINGSLSETCEVRYAGVPWGSLNNGARVQVGLDIIRTLQRHYGVAAPIWIDQAESVTRLPKMESQVIRLVVSEGDKTLRVEQEDRA